MGLAWYARYIGDYRRDTAHLSMIEHGAYALLMDHYYTAGPIPAHEDMEQPKFANAGANAPHLYRICSAIDSAEQRAVDSVLRQFFVVQDGFYHNKRADKEIEKRDEISEKRRIAQLKREELRKEKERKKASSDGAKDSANAHTTTTTTTDSIIEDTNVSSVRTFKTKDGNEMTFDQIADWIWDHYPRVNRTIRYKNKIVPSLKTALKKESKNEDKWNDVIRDITSGVAKYKRYCEATGEKPSDPFRWIANAGWKEDYSYSETTDRQSRSQDTRRSESAGTVHQIVDAGEKAKDFFDD